MFSIYNVSHHKIWYSYCYFTIWNTCFIYSNFITSCVFWFTWLHDNKEFIHMSHLMLFVWLCICDEIRKSAHYTTQWKVTLWKYNTLRWNNLNVAVCCNLFYNHWVFAKIKAIQGVRIIKYTSAGEAFTSQSWVKLLLSLFGLKWF